MRMQYVLGWLGGWCCGMAVCMLINGYTYAVGTLLGGLFITIAVGRRVWIQTVATGIVLILLAAGPSLAHAELLITIDGQGFCGRCDPAVPANYEFGYGGTEFRTTVSVAQVGDERFASPEQVVKFEPALVSENGSGWYSVFYDAHSIYGGQLTDGSPMLGITRHAPPLGPGLHGYHVTDVSITADTLDWTYVGVWNGVTDYRVRIYGMLWPPLPGDFNQNGAVDTADYLAWRDRYDTIGALPNGTGQIVVGDADLSLWRANFGNVVHFSESLASGLGSQSIPEPAALWLLWLCYAGGYLRPRAFRVEALV